MRTPLSIITNGMLPQRTPLSIITDGMLAVSSEKEDTAFTVPNNVGYQSTIHIASTDNNKSMDDEDILIIFKMLQQCR